MENWEGNAVQSTLATLLLITSTVVFACIVIDYAAGVAEQTLGTRDLPGLERLRGLESSVLNQTDFLLNQTLPVGPGTALPTLAPEP